MPFLPIGSPLLPAAQDDNNYLAFVASEARGLTVIDDWDGMGQKVTASGTVELDDVVVPAAHVVAHHELFTRPRHPWRRRPTAAYFHRCRAGTGSSGRGCSPGPGPGRRGGRRAWKGPPKIPCWSNASAN